MRDIFGWSYPPGVTGNEPEIVGEREAGTTNHIRVTGTMTFQSEQDGRSITRTIPTFGAAEDTPYIDLVDEAIELIDPTLPSLPDEYGWVQIDETINEEVVS